MALVGDDHVCMMAGSHHEAEGQPPIPEPEPLPENVSVSNVVAASSVVEAELMMDPS